MKIRLVTLLFLRHMSLAFSLSCSRSPSLHYELTKRTQPEQNFAHGVTTTSKEEFLFLVLFGLKEEEIKG